MNKEILWPVNRNGIEALWGLIYGESHAARMEAVNLVTRHLHIAAVCTKASQTSGSGKKDRSF
jgi:hypothetical protein